MMTYLAIIMTLTLVFSAIIYFLASSQFDRPAHPRFDYYSEFEPSIVRQQFEDLLRQRSSEAKADLLITLGLLNGGVLLLGAGFSYFLARKTLEPIEAAMDAESQFVSDASHELRTPLTALQTTNEVALRKKSLGLDEARELIGQNVAETIKLRELTNALLGLVQEERTDVPMSRLDLRNVVNDALQTIVPLAQAKSISVEDDIPELYVVANAHSLGQVIRILLENAVKYSPEGSTIRIKAHSNGEAAILQVIDHGVGIAAGDFDKIFRRFYRIDSSRSKQNVQGYGLGLAIAKAVCDRQGMKLGVESELGKGSVFTLGMNESM
jgi:signal transduction histidine kinase